MIPAVLPTDVPEEPLCVSYFPLNNNIVGLMFGVVKFLSFIEQNDCDYFIIFSRKYSGSFKIDM